MIQTVFLKKTKKMVHVVEVTWDWKMNPPFSEIKGAVDLMSQYPDPQVYIPDVSDIIDQNYMLFTDVVLTDDEVMILWMVLDKFP